MLQISFESDISSIRTEMPIWAQQRIPSITRNALNDTAPQGVDAERDKIRAVFDRPTPYTQRSVVFPRHLKATKDFLEAQVILRDEAPGGTPPSKYLEPQVQGGPRPPKPFERALRRVGVMRANEFAVIAGSYTRNAYGNIPGPRYVAILSQLQAFAEVGFSMNETAKSKKRAGRRRARYFVPKSGLPRGIYERQGDKVRAVLLFVSKAPTYRRRYAFGEATIATAARVFEGHWVRYFYAELAKATGQGRGSF